MKTAISLPDPLFAQLDARAKERGESRSGLIAEALRRYLKELEAADITRELNQTYTEETAREDREFAELAVRAYQSVLEREPW